jgi:hypothetical protein
LLLGSGLVAITMGAAENALTSRRTQPLMNHNSVRPRPRLASKQPNPVHFKTPWSENRASAGSYFLALSISELVDA